MARGVLVTGTDTGVGKTCISCMMIRQLRAAGVNVAAMKPVASGMVKSGDDWVSEDVVALQAADGKGLDTSIMNPYQYRPPVAPHLAARELGESIDVGHIMHCYRQLSSQSDMVVVEGAGGIATPLTDHENFASLASRLSLPVIVVVAIRLGCINHAILTIEYLARHGVETMGWVGNYPQPGERMEILESDLCERLAPPVLGIVPFNPVKNEVRLELQPLLDQVATNESKP